MPDTSANYLVMHGRHSSLVLEMPAGEAPVWRYWGPRLPDGAVPAAPLRDGRPLPSFMLDADQPLTVMPTFGVGWFGQSAVLAHRAGHAFAQAWTSCVLEWLEPGREAVLRLADAVAQVGAEIRLRLDADSDVLVASTVLANLGDTPLDVQWLAAFTLPLPGECDQVRSYAGQHLHEFMLQTDPLSRSLWRRENRRGRTSHDCFPGAVACTPGAGEDSGAVYGAHLAWSGNHQQTIEWLHDGQYQWQLGEWLAPGEGLLAPGGRLQTPELVASFSAAGWNGLAANFHAELRARLQWPQGRMRPRPVHLNTWEGFYFDIHPGPVSELASAAASVGIERFVLDDGWFHGRHHDRAALGDWWPDEGKFPDGLGELIAHVTGLGMEFGLWFEPEMINPDSELYRVHPEWALQLAGRPLLTARNQLVLDIARPEVAEYLFGKISALLSAHPIRYIKWDHNRDLTTAGLADGRPGYRAQVLAVYALMERLRAAYPDVEIESCSGGGGRIDFAVLRHTHRVWTSDCIDALSRIDIQRGFLQFFPPEIMGAHVGTAPAHTTGRSQSMAFRAAVALPGHLGVELDVRTLDPQDKAELAGWIALYKELRPQLHAGRVWTGQGGDGLLWQAHGDSGGDAILLFVYRREPSTHRYTPPLRLPMLDAGAHYRVTELRPESAVPATGHQAPLLDAIGSAEGMSFSGAWLVHAGLPVPRGKAQTAGIYRLDRHRLA
ncbi:alpha-galactosidase [Pseudoduganella umbonata]|uniref:Alpha-galactosidase n=1 Tax=Pseudoduganella umbonata TaxID=864828 RepID=A0A7W5E9Y2_9BURK|nr:alpha-galactosidase [Pseudoduganella umbonata]MBB3221256.1 alpha-galactosidase [Pseudoduganella umbonata]